jgi:hypothetical protein
VAQQKVVIKFPEKYKALTPVERLAVGREVVQYIRERTEKGLDKDGEKFPKYSNRYVKSLDFQNAGKSKSKVNLALSGDMMASIKLLNFNRAGEITIGLESGDPEEGKLEGNRKGTYGNSKPVTDPRDPLGIEDDKLKEILRSYDTRTVEDTEAIERAREKLLENLEQAQIEKKKSGGITDVSARIKFAGGVKGLSKKISQTISELEDDSGE